MNVAEAKRGMNRAAADEAGEDGKGQIVQAVVTIRNLLFILKATELVTFHLDQLKSSAFSPFLLVICPCFLPEPFPLICSAICREGSVVTISECRWAAHPFRAGSADHSLSEHRDASEKRVLCRLGSSPHRIASHARHPPCPPFSSPLHPVQGMLTSLVTLAANLPS